MSHTTIIYSTTISSSNAHIHRHPADPRAKALQSHGAAHAAGIVFEPRKSTDGENDETMDLLPEID